MLLANITSPLSMLSTLRILNPAVLSFFAHYEENLDIKFKRVNAPTSFKNLIGLNRKTEGDTQVMYYTKIV